MRIFGRVLVAVSLFGSWIAFADSWLPASPIVVSSPDTELIVRAIPGMVNETAKATYFRRQEVPEKYAVYQHAYLANALRPMEAHISNSGVLVTLDEYGHPGFENAVVVYDVSGNEVRAYDLQDIYTESALAEMPRTVSSRGWRNSEELVYFENDALRVHDIFGNILMFNLADGSISTFARHPEKFRPQVHIIEP